MVKGVITLLLVLCLVTVSFLILLRLAGFLSWWCAWSSCLFPVCIVSFFAGKGHLFGVDQQDPNNACALSDCEAGAYCTVWLILNVHTSVKHVHQF